MMFIDKITLKEEPFKFRLSGELNWDSIETSTDIEKIKLGESELGKELWAFKIGHGPKKVSLLAGCHSDEPLGPETLRRLVFGLTEKREDLGDLFSQITFYILPHINPDGESNNGIWMKDWPSFEAYTKNAFREKPGRDVEFGFPSMRVENKQWTNWLKTEGPFDLHISFHGMGYSEGPMLLIEKHGIERTKLLRKAFEEKVKQNHYLLHDHDRKGDKGFLYIGPGFTTTPEGGAMKAYFQAEGDDEMASKFHSSSMEWIRSLGGDPLCLVTELPLFCIKKKEGRKVGMPIHHLALKKELKENLNISELEGKYELEPFEIDLGLEFHLFVLKQGLKSILEDSNP